MKIELLYKSGSGEEEILTGALLPKVIDYTRNFRIYQKAWLFINLVLFSIVSCVTQYSFTEQQVETPAALKADEGATIPKGRARARNLGIKIGIYETGRYNAITDVAGVKVGHVTLNSGDSVRTGVTAIIPRDDIWNNKLFAASYIINGNGETTGIAWLNEAGWIETPIMLTNTLSVGRVHDGVVQYMIKRYPDDYVALPIVAECYDGMLNDIGGLHVTAEHAIEAIEKAADGPVAEGGVGAGTGMRCYEFKAGIGTASRVLPEETGG